uniref:Uncharacterized protein n=1 Tax=Plectus sambesii TaxID=2011161 RepID=A0A914WFF5_9BILA
MIEVLIEEKSVMLLRLATATAYRRAFGVGKVFCALGSSSTDNSTVAYDDVTLPPIVYEFAAGPEEYGTFGTSPAVDHQHRLYITKTISSFLNRRL